MSGSGVDSLMRRGALWALIAIWALLVAACGGAAAPASTTAPAATALSPSTSAPAASLRVLTTTTFLADMARNVAGDRLAIDALVPTGVDPHGFEPTPADLAKVADSNFLIVNGAGFEEFLAGLLENAGGDREVVEAAAGLKSREPSETEEVALTADDLADAACVAASSASVEAKSAGADAGGAVALLLEQREGEEHGVELFDVRLLRQPDGTYGGFFSFDAEHVEYQIASAEGTIRLLEGGTDDVQPEESFALACGGLTQGGVFQAEEGVHVLELSGFSSEQAPLLFGELGGHEHEEGDPHFWLDPNNAIVYVENIRDGLSKADPEGAAVYAANSDAYIAKLKELDAQIRQQVEEIPEANRLFVTNHESFGYFADRYGFTVIGTVVPSLSPGAQPSAQQLARLEERIKATGARAIFLETGSNPQLAEQIASDTGIRVEAELFTHSVSEPGGPAPTYIDMMKYNTAAIVEALR